MPSNSNGIDDYRGVPESIYQPIHPQSKEEILQVKHFRKFIEEASNYALYSLQKSLPVYVQLCTFDPLVWFPDELCEAILNHLSVEDLLALACCTKTWNWYMSSHPVWRSACPLVDPACAALCKTDADWMVASRDALAAIRALKAEGGLVTKRVNMLYLTGRTNLNERDIVRPPDCVVAKDGVLCAGFDVEGIFLMHDTTFGRTWALKRGSPVTCFRFINASKSSKKALQQVGMLLYGTPDGTVRAPIEHHLSTRLDYRRHAGAVISCDADMETEIVASIGRDFYLRIFSVWSMAMLCAVRINETASDVHVLKPHDGHFAVLVTEVKGTFTKYSWPITPGDPKKCKTNIATLNPTLNHFYENVYDTFSKFGDFLNIKEDKLIVERLDGDQLKYIMVQAESGTIGAVVVMSNKKVHAILVYDVHTLQPLFRCPLLSKVTRLVGAGRRFALIVISGVVLVDDRLVLLDLHAKNGFVSSVLIPPASSHPITGLHGCPSFQAIDSLPVTELRRARLEASQRCCLTQGQVPPSSLTNDGNPKPAAPLGLPVDDGEAGRGSGLLNVDPEEMERFSPLEDETRNLGDSDLKDFSGDTILYTGYDCETKSLFYVIWNLLAGQK